MLVCVNTPYFLWVNVPKLLASMCADKSDCITLIGLRPRIQQKRVASKGIKQLEGNITQTCISSLGDKPEEA